VREITADAAKLTWVPPTEDGGSPVTSYTVEMKQPMDYKWMTVSAEATISLPEHTVTGLRESVDYIFRVSASNKAGTGKPSEPSEVAKYGKCSFSPFKVLLKLAAHLELEVTVLSWLAAERDDLFKE
jgi:hypothetical protein